MVSKIVNLFPEKNTILNDKRIPESEKTTYKLFKSLGNDWYVWHSVEWMEKQDDLPLLLGESDFLIFNPKRGFLILEVKGGEIKRKLKKQLNNKPKDSYSNQILEDNNANWSRDYFEKNVFIENKPLKSNPFKQARKSMFYFLRFYNDYINSFKNQISPDLYKKLLTNQGFPGNYNCGVIFPDCFFKRDNKSPIFSFVEEMTFDAKDVKEQKDWERKLPSQKAPISPIEKYLNFLFDMYPKRNPPVELKDFLINMINYEIKTVFCLNSWLDSQEQILKKVNNIQEFTLDLLENKKKALFTGSAGTGKTFIAMKKFIREYNQGRKVLFLCYNKKLNEQINYYIKNTYFDELNKKIKDYKIITINALLHSIARKNLKQDKYNFFEEKMRLQQFEKVQEIIISILQDREDDVYKFDVLLIDEGQDIKNEFWPIIKEFQKNQKDGIFYVFYDQSQLKFNKDFDPNLIGLDLDRDTFLLTKNIRNADDIIHWIENETKLGNYKDYLGLSSIRYNLQPENFATLNEALKRAMEQAMGLHQKSLISPDKIIILCDKIFSYLLNEKYKITKNSLKSSKINWLEKKYALNLKNPTRKINYSLIETKSLKDFKTIREKKIDNVFISYSGIGAFKGLENDIVLLIIEAPDKTNKEKYEKYKRDVYIGASRARFLLFIFTYSNI